MFGYNQIIALLNHIVLQNDVISAQLSGDLAAVVKATASLKTSATGLAAGVAAQSGPQPGVHSMASPPVDPFAALEAQIAANVTVEGSALTLIDGFSAELTNAVNTALAGGATAAQIAALVTTQVTSLQNSAASLAAAVLANTPGGPVVPPTPAPVASAKKGGKP